MLGEWPKSRHVIVQSMGFIPPNEVQVTVLGSREPDLSTPCARTRVPLTLKRGGVQGVGKSGLQLRLLSGSIRMSLSGLGGSESALEPPALVARLHEIAMMDEAFQQRLVIPLLSGRSVAELGLVFANERKAQRNHRPVAWHLIGIGKIFSVPAGGPGPGISHDSRRKSVSIRRWNCGPIRTQPGAARRGPASSSPRADSRVAWRLSPAVQSKGARRLLRENRFLLRSKMK